MRGDVLLAVPPSAHKTHGSSLKLSLHDVKETEDEDEGNDSHKGSTAANHNNNNNNNNGNNNGNVSLTWADNKHAHSFDSSTDGAPKSPETTHSKKRSQSAKRPGQNGQSHSSDSPLSNRSPPSSKKLEPPKSAPSQKWRVSSSKGRTLRSRERGDSAGESAEHRAASPSHQQRPANRTSETPAGGGGGGGGVRSSSRQSKRRPPSRSEDFSSSSSGDLPFPRSTSDRQRPSLTGTSSSDSSDDPRQERPSLTSSGSLAGGGGGVKRGSLVGGGGGGYPASPTPSTGSRAWDFFEEHVRTIQGAGGDMFSSYQGPSFQASPTFQEAMVDMFGYPDYSHPPPTPVVNRGFAVAGAASRFLRLRKRSSAVGPLAGGGRERVVDQRTVDNAKRGWRILKQYVQENYTSKRTSQAALSWSMLRHTLKGMSDMQKARLDLYRRYGVIPTLNDDGSVVMVNTMLSERAQKAIANGSRHPLLVHSTKPHPHPLSASLPAALSSPLTSPRSSAGVGQRRASSSVVRGARVDVRPLSTMSGAGGSGVGLLSLRLGAPRHRSELSSRSSSRSHTP